jgi:hypothetical protein
MRKYHFKLVDAHFVADYGLHELVDETTAQIEAVKLAQSLRETRPDLIGQHCSISVTDEYGGGVCVVAIDLV